MSKWTEIRDNVTDALRVDDVTEKVKQDVSQTVLNEVLPVVENAADAFCETIKSQSAQESGWCRWRDGIVLPLLLQGAVYVVKVVLQKTINGVAAEGKA